MLLRLIKRLFKLYDREDLNFLTREERNLSYQLGYFDAKQNVPYYEWEEHIA